MEGNPAVVLETQRLTLREFDAQQGENIANYYQRNAAHFRASAPLRSHEHHRVEAWRERLRPPRSDPSSAVRFAIYQSAQAAEIVGHVELSEIARGAFLSCYLGYGIDARFQGRGIMFEALGAAIDYAFRTLGLHRIQANYVPTNERSARLLQRLGFQPEGFARDYLFLGGQWQDHVMTALLNPEPVVPRL